MKIFIKIVLTVSLLNCCSNNDQSDKKLTYTEKNPLQNESDSLYHDAIRHHLQILDSARKAHPNDTVYYCCTPSINFMELNSKIEASSDGTQLGRLAFTRVDLQKWHEWYEKR